MAVRLRPIDPNQIQTASVRQRSYGLPVESLGDLPEPSQPLQKFYQTLPRTGQAVVLLRAAELMAQTALESRPTLWVVDDALMDAGVSPLLIYLVRRRMVNYLAMNGRAAAHDFDLATHGATCENASEGLDDGMLGLGRETAEALNDIVNDGVQRGFSLGECLGRGILNRQPRHTALSLLAAAARLQTPVTIHAAIGAEGFHAHPNADGMMLGKGSLRDARILANIVSQLPSGGLIVAVHRDPALHRTLLQAYALARNVNRSLGGLNVLRLGDEVPALDDLPDLSEQVALPGALELILPLLFGRLFSLVE